MRERLRSDRGTKAERTQGRDESATVQQRSTGRQWDGSRDQQRSDSSASRAERNNSSDRGWSRPDATTRRENRGRDDGGAQNRQGDDRYEGGRGRGGSSNGAWNRGNSSYGSHGSYGSHQSYGSHNSSGHYGGRQPYYAHGRVSRIDPWNHGFRVWVAGAPFPFFYPAALFHNHGIRIGINLGVPGYYNDAGYYDPYYGSVATSDGYLRGSVESVDWRNGTFVLRNEATGNFVTVVERDRRDDVRPGDYVELQGDWTRSGIFNAYDVRYLQRY